MPDLIPTTVDQTRIADALHAAVDDILGPATQPGPQQSAPAGPTVSGLTGRCIYYACAGQKLLKEELGLDFQIVMGSLGVLVNERGEGFGYQTENHGGTADEFHVWLAAEGMDGSIVVVDFSAKEFPLLAEHLGSDPPLRDIPEFTWDSDQNTRSRFGVRYSADPRLTSAKLSGILQRQSDTLGSIIDRARAILATAAGDDPPGSAPSA